MLIDKEFGSKILLFGEYSVLNGSGALSIPYSSFSGKLEFYKGDRTCVDRELLSFVVYLKNLDEADKKFLDVDIDAFSFDVESGLLFQSSIPQGYGVGSSGALCASIYANYCKNPTDNIQKLKNVFTILESHFHGASSGSDPLVPYLGSAIYLKKDIGILKVSIDNSLESDEGFFILNTHRSRRTEPLVNLFLEKQKNPRFEEICRNELVSYSDKCIEYTLEKNREKLFESVKELSKFQFEHFAPMIPKLSMDLWEEGLSSDLYSLKLCGAGGGGFILGHTKSFKKLFLEYKDYKIKRVLGI